MKDVSKILKKQYYGNRSLRANSRVGKRLATGGAVLFSYPRWLPALFIAIIAVSCMGEDKVLNQQFRGLPKAITLGVLVMAFLVLILRGELKRLRVIGGVSLMYILYWSALSLWSAILWVINFSGNDAISRGIEKMLFQTIAVLVAIAAVYVFGGKTIDYFAVGIYIANGMICLIEMPNYGGPAASLESLFNLIISFGEGSGYALALEIHEVTLLFGMFLIYYLVFAPRETEKDKRRNRLHIIFSIIFLFTGFKRALIFCVPLVAFAAWFIRRRKKPFTFLMLIGIFWVVFFAIYLYAVYTGAAKRIIKDIGIDMMGRDYIWDLAKRYYTVSPLYMGQGFGTVDGVIVAQMFEQGLVNKAYPLHNDILKVYIEFGFPGFLVWTGAQYILFPILFKKFFDLDTAVLYMSILTLMSTTYLTDNTAFYFWCMMALRLIPLSYGVYRKNKFGVAIKEEKAKWSPPSQTDFQQLVREQMAKAKEGST